MLSLSYGLQDHSGPLSPRMESCCVVKNTFLDFLDEATTRAADMREPRCLSEPPWRFNATATVPCAQIGNGWSWSRQATPEKQLEQRELDLSRSIIEPSGHFWHQTALLWTKPKPFRNDNPGVSACSNEGIPACDTESLEERIKTQDCLSPWHQHHTGFDNLNLAAGICNSLFASETLVGSAVPGTGNHHSNRVDNMRSQPCQEGSCDNSADEWDGLGMDKLSRFCAHKPNNLHKSNEGSESGSATLCNSKHEAVESGLVQLTAAVDSPKHAKKLRGRRKRATPGAVNYALSGEQNIAFTENTKQYADKGDSQHPRGNSQNDGRHACCVGHRCALSGLWQALWR